MTVTNASLNSLVETERTKQASLAKSLLGHEIQLNEMHDSAEDGFASLEIFLKCRGLFEEAVPRLCSSKTAILKDGLFI